MPPESEDNLQLQIGYVLFLDIVGYSKLLIEEQKERLRQLTAIVLGTSQVAKSSDEQLVRLPTGDGMALVFHHSAEEPARCALEVAEALRKHPEIPVRMGIHSGPVSAVTDVSGRSNIAGAGINLAQRVMDCGDAGHILLSQHVADDLVQYRQWAPRLHDLGECEVKHGVRLHLVNLYADMVGNPAPPSKFKGARVIPPGNAGARKNRTWVLAGIFAIVLSLIGLAIVAIIFMPALLKNSLRRETGAGSASQSPVVTAATIPEKSIAVLPFENLSSDKENAYFTDGVQDEILTDLAKIADLKVISRTSVMQYKTGAQRNLREIGKQLGVAHLLEGSVQRAGKKVRVNAQLIDARTDVHQWAENYDRPLDDVFAIQSEIAKTIADQLQAKLSPNEKVAIEKPPTKDVTAFDLYSRAKTLLLTTAFSLSQDRKYEEAIQDLNGAIARDPSFFAAYCQLVYAHDSRYALGVDHTPARLALAENALAGAARLQPNVPEMHLARARHFYYALRDYKAATAELEIARQGLANDPEIFELSGYILRRQGKQEEALRDLERAVELDPRNAFILTQVSLSYQFLRRYPEEIAVLNRALEITPNDAAVQATRAIVDFIWKADPQPLHQVVERIRTQQTADLSEVDDNWFSCALAERDWPWAEQALAVLNGAAFWGDGSLTLRGHFNEGLLARAMHDETRARKAFTVARQEQEQIVQQQQDFAPAVCVLGLIDAGLGNKEAALREGKRALELLPVEKDSTNGQRLIVYYAIIAAWVGEKDLAIHQLTLGARTPGGAFIASYGVLKLLPFWDPLRGDPRFEKIVSSLAPK